MTTFAVLAPLLAQVSITFLLMFGMVVTRRRAVMDKQVDPKDLALRGANPWPRQAAQFGDAYQNSLELPVVFYALVIVAFVTKEADVVFVVLSWIFVLCRILQAYVHATSNIRKYRSLAFRAGALVLFIMLIWLTVHISLI